MGISKIGVLSPELVTGSVVRRVGPSSPSPSLSMSRKEGTPPKNQRWNKEINV